MRILKWLLEIDEGEGRLGEVGFELSFLDMMLTVMRLDLKMGCSTVFENMERTDVDANDKKYGESEIEGVFLWIWSTR